MRLTFNRWIYAIITICLLFVNVDSLIHAYVTHTHTLLKLTKGVRLLTELCVAVLVIQFDPCMGATHTFHRLRETTNMAKYSKKIKIEMRSVFESAEGENSNKNFRFLCPNVCAYEFIMCKRRRRRRRQKCRAQQQRLPQTHEFECRSPRHIQEEEKKLFSEWFMQWESIASNSNDNNVGQFIFFQFKIGKYVVGT